MCDLIFLCLKNLKHFVLNNLWLLLIKILQINQNTHFPRPDKCTIHTYHQFLYLGCVSQPTPSAIESFNCLSSLKILLFQEFNTLKAFPWLMIKLNQLLQLFRHYNSIFQQTINYSFYTFFIGYSPSQEIWIVFVINRTSSNIYALEFTTYN